MAQRKSGLTKQQQKQLEQAAAGAVNEFNKLSGPAKGVVVAILLVLTLLAGGWYFIGGGSSYVQNLSGTESTARTDVTGDYAWTEWNEGESPNYYRVDGAAIVEHDEVSPGDIAYGDLDGLGRATYAVGYITGPMFQKELEEAREQNLPKPVGYQSYYVGERTSSRVPVIGDGIDYWNGIHYEGYFYNRSHLLADSLCGDPTKQNLITGTRCQNTGTNNEGSSGYGGMAYTEELTRQYFKEHSSGQVYYAVTPIYSGDELLPRSVYVDVKSDDGIINLHVETYNAAKGYVIDYKTGEAKAA